MLAHWEIVLHAISGEWGITGPGMIHGRPGRRALADELSASRVFACPRT